MVNKANSEMSGFTDFKFTVWAVKGLAIFRGCAGSSEPSLLFHEIKYVNIKFIKMQDCARLGVNYFEKVINYIQLHWKLFN